MDDFFTKTSFLERLLKESEDLSSKIPEAGDSITVGIFKGIICINSSNKYYVFFEPMSYNNNKTHNEICRILHSSISNFFKLAEQYGAVNHTHTDCFPCFPTISNLLEFVIELNDINNSVNQKTNETKLQRSKASFTRGNVPEGHQICGRKSKTAACSGHLSYRVCNF